MPEANSSRKNSITLLLILNGRLEKFAAKCNMTLFGSISSVSFVYYQTLAYFRC